MAYTAEQFFGKIGVSKGIFTQEELDECFKIQHSRYKKNGYREPLSYILQEKKLVTREQIYNILQEFKYSCLRRDDKKVAELIKQKGMLSEDEVEIALNFQRKLFRNGVGLFQLGEILISKEILDEEEVYEILCDYWLLRNPDKELPEYAKPQQLIEIGKKSDISSTTKMQVDKIHESEGRSGYKVCEICNYENALSANYCQGCSERLLKYTFKLKTDIGNITLFKKEINENAGPDEEVSFAKCSECGFKSPVGVEICLRCLAPLHPDSNIQTTQTQIIGELSKSEEVDDENSVQLKDLPETLEFEESKSVNGIAKSPHFLIEVRKNEIVNDDLINEYQNEDSSCVGDTLIYEPLIYDPSSSKLFVPATSATESQKRCPQCGYVNPDILPFCFGCLELFDKKMLLDQPNIRPQKI